MGLYAYNGVSPALPVISAFLYALGVDRFFSRYIGRSTGGSLLDHNDPVIFRVKAQIFIDAYW